jgi:hypothetical protein
MVAVVVHDVRLTIAEEHPATTIWLGVPAYVGEKAVLGNEVNGPEVAVNV